MVVVMAMSFVSQGESEIVPWPREVIRGRVEEVDKNMWNMFGGAPKKFVLVTSEVICDSFQYHDTE